MSNRIVQSTVKICRLVILKVAALKPRAAVFLELPLQSQEQLFSWSFLYKAFHKQTTRETKYLKELPEVLLNSSVRSSQGSCFKVI